LSIKTERGRVSTFDILILDLGTSYFYDDVMQASSFILLLFIFIP